MGCPGKYVCVTEDFLLSAFVITVLCCTTTTTHSKIRTGCNGKRTPSSDQHSPSSNYNTNLPSFHLCHSWFHLPILGRTQRTDMSVSKISTLPPPLLNTTLKGVFKSGVVFGQWLINLHGEILSLMGGGGGGSPLHSSCTNCSRGESRVQIAVTGWSERQSPYLGHTKRSCP